MKKLIRFVSLFLSLVICLCLFCSCSAKLKFKNGKIVDSKTGVEYSFVSSVYLPKTVSTEVYAVFEHNDVKIDYFSIQDVDPEKWLVSENHDVIYSGDVTELPDLRGYNPNQMLICYNYDTPLSIVDERDASQISSIIEAFTNGDVETPTMYDYTTYKIIFVSEEYPDFYYMLRLRVTEDKMYLCDLSTGAHVDVTDLFNTYSDITFEAEYFE